MTYRVFDDKFENSTTLIVHVLDVNDNAPRFDNAVYNVLDLNEEEPGISKSDPKYLLTVVFRFFPVVVVLSFSPATFLWPHLKCDVGLESGVEAAELSLCIENLYFTIRW